MLTRELLKTLVVYNPETGEMDSLKPYHKTRRPSVNYLSMRISGKKYAVHQLAFMYMVGYIPKLIDHIDQDIQNNSWNNLRVASKSLNGLNTSKRIGVYKRGKKWIAKCCVNKNQKHLGTFNTFEEALKAYNIYKGAYT